MITQRTSTVSITTTAYLPKVFRNKKNVYVLHFVTSRHSPFPISPLPQGVSFPVPKVMTGNSVLEVEEGTKEAVLVSLVSKVEVSPGVVTIPINAVGELVVELTSGLLGKITTVPFKKNNGEPFPLVPVIVTLKLSEGKLDGNANVSSMV